MAGAGFEIERAQRRPDGRADVVERSGFDNVRPTTPAPELAARPAAATSPVEVLFKPAPVYTDEARANRVEGEVLVEVEFAATGTIRVLRIVRGLGFGLDQMAARAASGMRFKPATEDGRPMTVRATIQIVFRLS